MTGFLIVPTFLLYLYTIKTSHPKTIMFMSSESLRSRREDIGRRICVRCGDGFSLLFNRRLECGDCGLGMCRSGSCCQLIGFALGLINIR